MSQPDLQEVGRIGVEALQSGNFVAARENFETIVAAGRATAQLWLLLAKACDESGDFRSAHAALDELLRVAPRHLEAMLMKGEIYARTRDDRSAVAWFNTAIDTSKSMPELPPVMLSALNRAKSARDSAGQRFERHLHVQLAAVGVDAMQAPARFSEALRILAGGARPYFQEPTSFFYPRLPHVPFFETSEFPWIAALEAAVPAMRAEVEAVLAIQRGIIPYVERADNRPSQGDILVGDANWSAFHLWKDGVLVVDNAAACPQTIAALQNVPFVRIAGRSPMALFSILRARTHIPPHNGMLNTRLICHIPLIVPQNCRLRVGNETRTVEAGRAMVFDDSIEHEAWNDSDEPRAILLFEIWRPELDADERKALTAMFEAVTSYGAFA